MSDPLPARAEAVLEAMARHRSVRAFEDRPVCPGWVEAAIRSAQCAATSSWIQAYQLLELPKGSRRDAISVLAGDQKQIREAPLFFVVAGDTRRHRLVARAAGQDHVECTETFLLSVIDATLFAQNLVLALESMGLGTCYIGGLRNDLKGVDQVIHVPKGTFPLFGLCAGWPAEDPGTRPRLGPRDIWTQDRFPTDQELEATIEGFDGVASRYYERRGAPGRNWSGAIWRKFRTALRPALKSFFESKGASLS